MVNKGNHPQMALIQVSEILQFTQTYQLETKAKKGFLMGLRKDRKVESDSETVVNLSISIFLGAPPRNAAYVGGEFRSPLKFGQTRMLTDESCTGQTWPQNPDVYG